MAFQRNAFRMLLVVAAIVSTNGCATKLPIGTETPLAPTMQTITWTVPAGLPAAGTVRKAFIISPVAQKAGTPTVIYFWSQYADNLNAVGAWRIPEAGTGAAQIGVPVITDPNVAAMVARGLTVIGLDQGDDFGSHRSEIPLFVQFMHDKFDTSLVIHAWVRSRGGMHGFNLAADYPFLFDRIGGIAPITDAAAYDTFGMAKSYTGIIDPKAALAAYTLVPPGGLSIKQQNTPNLRTKPLVSAGIPIAIAYGTSDEVVPNENNVLAFALNYSASGGDNLTLYPIDGGKHDTTTKIINPLIEFMTK